MSVLLVRASWASPWRKTCARRDFRSSATIRPGGKHRLRDIGGIAAASPREVAEDCRTILFSLPSVEAFAESVGGENGVAKPHRSVARSSLSVRHLPLDVKRAALDVLATGGKIMLDCPVSGTGAQAARKDLVIFGSGDRRRIRTFAPGHGRDVTRCNAISASSAMAAS